jgi:hypothetical protein
MLIKILNKKSFKKRVIHQDQMGFVSGIRIQFGTQKPFSGMHINKIKDKITLSS